LKAHLYFRDERVPSCVVIAVPIARRARELSTDGRAAKTAMALGVSVERRQIPIETKLARFVRFFEILVYMRVAHIEIPSRLGSWKTARSSKSKKDRREPCPAPGAALFAFLGDKL
jgi:hypothetical protein